jgi:hypothetical protein
VRRRCRQRLEHAGLDELGASGGEVSAAAEVLEHDRGDEHLGLLVGSRRAIRLARPSGTSPGRTSSTSSGMPWRRT